MIPKNWKAYLTWAIGVAIIALLVAWGLLPKDTPIPPPPLPTFDEAQIQERCGWQRDDQAVKAVADTLLFKAFADTPAGQAADPLPDHVYLWESFNKVLGRGPPSKDQGQIGSCVSFGTNNAVTYTLATQLATQGGDAGQFRDIAEEVTYGGSRVQVGGGRIRGDGSVGAWAAQFVNKWGIVAREKHGEYDLTTYSVSRCREFGSRGVPAPLQEIAKQRAVKDITLVKTWAEAKKALASGYAIAVCSDRGFRMQRDSNGICEPSGQWNHCMAIIGYATINGREYGRIENSWGPNAHTGPLGPGNPPPSGFYADSKVIHGMLGQGDSWAFSAVQGWPARKLNWFIRHDNRAEPLERLALNGRREVLYAMAP